MLDDCGLPCCCGPVISLVVSKVESDSVVNRGLLLNWSLMIWSTCEDNEDRPLDRADRVSQDQGVRKGQMRGIGVGHRGMGRREGWVGKATIAATRERRRNQWVRFVDVSVRNRGLVCNGIGHIRLCRLVAA
ncbi:uncharacterized protein BDZ83DRAFT_383559 [Colletotrichum acutatum]|uniref:Uncharacterized protein n=1 Tax=Glomerella acutata TaxID=27357 RepID=A0AAD8XE10_GLOAC|nr:uncharacterized protein BDZ83DRAFT_383559 [Colletotrichum acutatum]KAK1723732.1 hypothetical protein BDZ83DRAFT_383559 [Colletotrichum acutatum]